VGGGDYLRYASSESFDKRTPYFCVSELHMPGNEILSCMHTASLFISFIRKEKLYLLWQFEI